MAGGTSRVKRKEEGIIQTINRILDEAERTRQGFTPEVLREFEEEGRSASLRREERAPEKQERMREVPSRQLGNVVVRRTEEARFMLSPHMTQRAVEEAVALGERLELAAQGRRPLREW